MYSETIGNPKYEIEFFIEPMWYWAENSNESADYTYEDYHKDWLENCKIKYFAGYCSWEKERRHFDSIESAIKFYRKNGYEYNRNLELKRLSKSS